jgi:hypothetical protein
MGNKLSVKCPVYIHFLAFHLKQFPPRLIIAQIFGASLCAGGVLLGDSCNRQQATKMKHRNTTQLFAPSPHCGTYDSVKTAFLVESFSGRHSTFDDKGGLEDGALEISVGNAFELSAVGMDSL